jgi:filamentous hemagglutinin family protein
MPFVAIDCARNAHGTRHRRNLVDKNLLLGVATVALIASPAVHANPLGGAVTTGSASISTSANKTSVNQKSEDVVINWSSFNIGSGQTTEFVQPSAQAIAVNRVGGANASQILGTLDANGRVVLINGNGVLFGKGAQVNVGSLIATSTDGSDSDLLAGKFSQAGNENARIVNQGQITAANGGVVALVAPNVTNTGTVNAKLGTVALGAANKFTVDFAGDGLVSFAAQGDVNARASASNSGLLSGTNVSMTAHAANGIATGIVNMSGIITAQGVQDVGGTIYLNAGNGTLTTTGTLNAAGATGGGQIETSGETVNISGHVTGGKGGLWKVDPEDLTIDSNAATTIDGALNLGTSVLEQTTSGAASGTGNQTSGQGNINVESALSWNSTATLTLDAYHSLNILAPIAVTGAGGLVLQYNDAATDGVLSFGFGSTGFAGNVAFTDVIANATQGSLNINSNVYTLANNVSQLSADISSNATGFYALANSYNASGDGTYAQSPISTTLTGTFEGLGNTISNLMVDDPTPGHYVGLFSQLGAGGAVHDIGLAVESITGGANGLVGGLVALSYGTVFNVTTGGTVTGGASSYDGGLEGYNLATIENSFATNATAGGTSAGAGGLVGYNEGTIETSYASGATTGGAHAYVGGLVGYNGVANIQNSFAMGSASGGASAFVGGLVGYNDVSTTVQDSYATGAVSGGAGTYAGGLIGYDGANSGSISHSYWDMNTSGVTNAAQGAGYPGNDSGITGDTTAVLQTALPSGFSGSIWSVVPGVSYPYLSWQFSGTPDVVAGFTLAPNGKTGVTGLNPSLLVDGQSVTPSVDMTSGANGYYYLLLAPGTISNTGSPLFAYVLGTAPGASYVANAIGGDGALKIEEDELREKSGASTATGLNAGFETAIDDNIGFLISIFQSEPNANFFLDDSAANFNLNSPFNSGGGTFWFYDPNGALSESGSGTITAGVLRGTTKNGVTLNGTNDIGALGGFTNTGGGGFSLTNSDWLHVDGSVNAGTGNLSLTTTANGIVIAGDLTAGGTVALTAGSGIWQDLNSSISAQALTGSSNGTARFQGANQIADLGAFDVNDGNFLLTNDQTLTVTGTVGANVILLQTTSGDLVDSGAFHANVVTLEASLGEVYGTGNIDAAVLNVTADTGIDLDGTTNDITHVKTDTTNSGPNVINSN